MSVIGNEPPIGSIVVDSNIVGFPWTRTLGGWTRQGVEGYLTWKGVYDWHQQAVDNPEDDTTEPFSPMALVWGNTIKVKAKPKRFTPDMIGQVVIVKEIRKDGTEAARQIGRLLMYVENDGDTTLRYRFLGDQATTSWRDLNGSTETQDGYRVAGWAEAAQEGVNATRGEVELYEPSGHTHIGGFHS